MKSSYDSKNLEDKIQSLLSHSQSPSWSEPYPLHDSHMASILSSKQARLCILLPLPNQLPLMFYLFLCFILFKKLVREDGV